MQLALAAGPDGHGTASGLLPTTRTTRLVAAGVALAGAGLIAVNPVAPVLPMHVHQAAVQLTGTWDTAADNWASLMDGFAANPDPIGNAIGELVDHYNTIATNSFEGMQAGIEGIWTGMGGAKGLETVLPQIMDYLQNGDVTNAYNLINNEMLFGMNNVFQPLFDHTVRGTGEFVPGVFGIGADMTRVFANVQDLFGDFTFWKSAAKYLMEPFIGFQFALSDNLTDTGDHVAQDPFDALLNGYVPWAAPGGSDADPHAAFIGLLTENGTLNYLFETLPNKIADALTLNLPADDAGSAAALAATDGVSLTDLFGDSSVWSDVLDGSVWSSLWDGSIWTDLFAGALG